MVKNHYKTKGYIKLISKFLAVGRTTIPGLPQFLRAADNVGNDQCICNILNQGPQTRIHETDKSCPL